MQSAGQPVCQSLSPPVNLVKLKSSQFCSVQLSAFVRSIQVISFHSSIHVSTVQFSSFHVIQPSLFNSTPFSSLIHSVRFSLFLHNTSCCVSQAGPDDTKPSLPIGSFFSLESPSSYELPPPPRAGTTGITIY